MIVPTTAASSSQTMLFAWINREGRYEPIVVTGARVREDDVFLMLEGVADRNAAEALRGVKLWVARAHARQLGEDEVYIADILGAEACLLYTSKPRP